MNEQDDSRRRFLISAGVAVSGAWFASNWPAVAAAAEHARHAANSPEPVPFAFLDAREVADIDAMAAQILPGGASAGAREAHATHFIDRALATFFSDRAPAFRSGLEQFRLAFREAHPSVASFATASGLQQIAFLRSVDRTPFFASVRALTIMGTLASSRYGGNHEGLGWKLMGFEDQHVFEPPFGYYDRSYAGFVPDLPGKKA
jgi:gluconate 2-dehydrogenase gamma chain